jgi:hypothetical protein
MSAFVIYEFFFVCGFVEVVEGPPKLWRDVVCSQITKLCIFVVLTITNMAKMRNFESMSD